jgi:cellulose synthase/poly-beta-1,6-N-acetylglucosamine synthase-like glycosyltransferase
MVLHKKLPPFQRNAIRPTMLLATVGLWAALNIYFAGTYIEIVSSQSGWAGKLVAAIVIAWIVLTSFYAGFHLMSLLFSVMIRKLCKQAARSYSCTPAVAILYPCMNDMKEKAIAACLAQDYPSYALYVLDDSSTHAERKRVNALKAKHGDRISIIRRETRKGFKAGNLNNALRILGDQYKYICVVDADELVPASFLREMVSIAEGDEQLGFVQAAHRQYGETDYAKRTGDSIDLHWAYFLPARNVFGFVYSYGHGVLFRSQALTAVGGFPAIASEDIAISTKLREVGYRGYYAYDIESSEEAPPSYEAFRRRNHKIVSGTLEFLFDFYPSFFRATRVSIVEKIDLLLALLVIYLPIPFVGFLFVLYGLAPFLAREKVGAKYIYSILLFDTHSWGFLVFMLFTVFAPLSYLLPGLIRSPKKIIPYILRMATIYLSVCLHTVRATLKWLATRQAPFTPTGDRTQRLPLSATEYGECGLGLLMITVGILMGVFTLAAVGLSLTLVPILVKRNLDGRITLILSVFPAFMTIVAVLGMPILLVGVTGMFAGVALAQH